MIEERKIYVNMKKIHCYFEKWIFHNGEPVGEDAVYFKSDNCNLEET
jgi:hypothetical protein